MISKTRGHPNLTPMLSGTPSGIRYCKYSKFPVTCQFKSGSDARKLKEMCPRCQQIVPKRTVPNGTKQGLFLLFEMSFATSNLYLINNQA